jgi:hypothetical protein
MTTGGESGNKHGSRSTYPLKVTKEVVFRMLIGDNPFLFRDLEKLNTDHVKFSEQERARERQETLQRLQK